MDAKLVDILSQVLNIPRDRIGPDTSVETESAWDSLAHMNLVFAIEEAFDVRFDDDQIAGITSVARIQAALAGKSPSAGGATA